MDTLKTFMIIMNQVFVFAVFPHFGFKEVLDLHKINFFILILFSVFLRKYCHPLPSCSQHHINQKQNKVYIFAKPTFQEVTQCHHTNTLLIFFLISDTICFTLTNLFTDFQDCVLLKLLLHSNNAKYSHLL